MNWKLKLEKISASKRLSLEHILQTSYTPDKSRNYLVEKRSDISGFNERYENKITHDLQKTLRKFVTAFIKEQPADIIDYAVMHFSDIQQKRIRAMAATGYPQAIDDSSSSLSLDFDAIQQLKPEEDQGSSHRASVTSEKFNSLGDSISDDYRCIIPKRDSQRVRLLQSIRDCLIFQTLEKDKLNVIVDAMYEMVVSEGERIITEGEEGDNFYVIENGAYNVIKEGSLVKTLTMGTFGEMALLYSTPREATIEAATAGCLWVLDRQTFRKILHMHALKQQEKYEELVSCTPLIKNLHKYYRMKLLEHLETIELPAGALIMQSGDDVKGLYFIIAGQCSIYYVLEDGSKEVFIKYRSKGTYFGDIELILNIKTYANVYAASDVKLAFLKAKYFKSCLGMAMEEMIVHLQQYNIKEDYLIDKIANLVKMRKHAKEQENILNQK